MAPDVSKAQDAKPFAVNWETVSPPAKVTATGDEDEPEDGDAPIWPVSFRPQQLTAPLFAKAHM